ncbi:unknown [Crocosphaera subtropica ATCC 51142]|uniref:Uncharacterized protein n=1 Tax=Crocosphaera subtropica (strain ATCC 51142 / BH68) TaxID=43989 RepID=B1WR03_CROS5|nr:hypothetical protein [Crocosphaera subtropica]ACB50061.1 unknown [Crocosphaera subtropica ATCC 51142]
MLKKLFGGSKKKEFFLELDETDNAPASEPKVETPASEAEETPEPQPEAPQAEGTEMTEQPAPAKKKSKKKSVKKAAKKEEPKTEIVPTSPALSNGQVAKKEEPKEVEFATKFYMISTPRRRPGPSLNNFKNMASQVKTRRG